MLLLDEPFRCLHKDVLPFLAQLMQDICDQLNLQIICITHEKELTNGRPEKDRSFEVRKVNGISKVEQIA
jgi:predicted ATPase